MYRLTIRSSKDATSARICELLQDHFWNNPSLHPLALLNVICRSFSISFRLSNYLFPVSKQPSNKMHEFTRMFVVQIKLFSRLLGIRPSSCPPHGFSQACMAGKYVTLSMTVCYIWTILCGVAGVSVVVRSLSPSRTLSEAAAWQEVAVAAWQCWCWPVLVCR